MIYYHCQLEGASPVPTNTMQFDITSKNAVTGKCFSSSTKTLLCKFPTELWLVRRKRWIVRRWVQESKREIAFIYNLHFSRCPQQDILSTSAFSRCFSKHTFLCYQHTWSSFESRNCYFLKTRCISFISFLYGKLESLCKVRYWAVLLTAS